MLLFRKTLRDIKTGFSGVFYCPRSEDRALKYPAESRNTLIN